MKLQRFVVSVVSCLILIFFADAVMIEISKLHPGSDVAMAEQIKSAVSQSEETLNDGFHLRYAFYEYAGFFNRLIGRRNLEKTYRLPSGHLVTVGENGDISDSVKGMLSLQDFCSAEGIPLLYVNLPARFIRDEDLAPFGVSDLTPLRSARLVSELSAAGVDTLDMRPVLADRYEVPYDAFFKTDHHWKISTGLFCAQILSEQLRDRYGIELSPELIRDEAFSVTLMENSWLGERGRNTGSAYSGMDDFELIEPIAETHFRLTIPSRETDVTGDFSVMLDKSRYDTDYWGRRYGPSFYYGYLFGNDPIQIIENLDHDGGKILIIKDSFSQSVNPFLAMTANTLVSWDVRYNDNSLQEYIAENDFDAVVVMYCESMINRHFGDRFMYDFS